MYMYVCIDDLNFGSMTQSCKALALAHFAPPSLLPAAPPALPVLHLDIVAGVEGLPEPVGHPAAVQLLAPLVVLEELVQQGQVGALPLLQASERTVR